MISKSSVPPFDKKLHRLTDAEEEVTQVVPVLSKGASETIGTAVRVPNFDVDH